MEERWSGTKELARRGPKTGRSRGILPMNLETLFVLSNALVLPFWFLMIVLPHWSWTKRIIGSPLIVLPTALLYVILIIPNLGLVIEGFSNPILADLAAGFSNPEVALLTWLHLLTYDLFGGRWAYLDSQKRRINPWLMAVVLFFLLMLGPFGLVLYLIVRASTTDKS